MTTVLIIDDEKEKSDKIERVLRLALSDSAIEVITRKTSQEVEMISGVVWGTIDLICVDLALGEASEVNGGELIRRFLKYRNIPILGTSSVKGFPREANLDVDMFEVNLYLDNLDAPGGLEPQDEIWFQEFQKDLLRLLGR